MTSHYDTFQEKRIPKQIFFLEKIKSIQKKTIRTSNS